jgi:acid stress chaperone HdeB
VRPVFHQPDDAIQNDDQRPLLSAEEASYRRVQRNVRSQREPLMKKTAFVSSALAILFASSIVHAQAQVTVDVSKITCDQFVEYKITDPKQIATWINGYYHGAHGSPMLDTQEMLEITNTVEEHCFKHPGDLVMKSVEGAMGPR